MAIATPGAPEAAGVIQQEALKVAKPELSANAAAKAKLAEVHKQAGARAALEDAKKALDPKEQFAQGLTEERRKQAVDGNIQGATLEQQAKRDAVDATLQAADAYAKKGFEGLAPPADAAFARSVLDRVTQVPWLSESMRAMSRDEGAAFFKSLTEDPQYAANFNRLLQERANYRITDADKTARLAELQKSNPSATWEEAAGQLEREWQDSVQNIPADAATELMSQQLDHAISLTDKDVDELDAKTKTLAAGKGVQVAQGVMEQFRRRWEQRGVMGIDDQRKPDFDTYAKGGLKAVFDRAGIPADQQDVILNNPDVRAQYDSQFAESFVNQRLRTGKLTKDNIYSIVDDPALGDTQEARVAKLQSMMESNRQLQQLIKTGQASGEIQRGLWEKMKDLSPHKRANLLTAMLSLLVLPAAAAKELISHEMGN